VAEFHEHVGPRPGRRPAVGLSSRCGRCILGSILGIVFGLVTVYVRARGGTFNFSALDSDRRPRYHGLQAAGAKLGAGQNIVQTVGLGRRVHCPRESVYTMPALLFLGYELELWRIFWLALIGGVIGVLFMVPLRAHLIVKEHGKLIYPEGKACADIPHLG